MNEKKLKLLCLYQDTKSGIKGSDYLLSTVYVNTRLHCTLYVHVSIIQHIHEQVIYKHWIYSRSLIWHMYLQPCTNLDVF